MSGKMVFGSASQVRFSLPQNASSFIYAAATPRVGEKKNVLETDLFSGVCYQKVVAGSAPQTLTLQ
jgi:hypothetical protein